MANWKKKLNRELDGIVRAMPSEFAPAAATVRAEATRRKRRIFRFTAVASACALLLGILLPILIVLAPFDPNTGGVILMQINPAVRLYTDEEGDVTAVYSENAEGDMMLADSNFTSSLQGAPASEAVKKLAERALAMGFVSEGEDAVRLTVAADRSSYAEQLQSTAETSAVEYFCGKGLFVPVLSRTVPLSFFGEGKNVQQLTQQALEAPVTETERGAAATSPEQVEENYRSSLYDYAREVTDYVYRTARMKKEMLAQIEALNEQIMAHADNPRPLGIPLSYWTLKYSSGYELTEALSALIRQTDAVLSEYNARFGQDLQSTDGYLLFLALNSFYIALDLQLLEENVNALLSLAENFAEIFDPSAFLRFIAGDSTMEQTVADLFSGIGEIPKTVEEYITSSMEMLQRQADLALQENKTDFTAVLPPLSYEEYGAKLHELREQFKNFEDFWNSFQ